MKSRVFTSEEKAKFVEDGYLILEDFFSPDQCEEMRKECKRIVDEMNPEEHKEIFSTEAHEQTKSDYMLNSNDKISFFWETEARNVNGELVKPKFSALNKIGHALHARSPVFKAATFDERISDILRQLGFVRPVVPQSMYIFKIPAISHRQYLSHLEDLGDASSSVMSVPDISLGTQFGRTYCDS